MIDIQRIVFSEFDNLPENKKLIKELKDYTKKENEFLETLSEEQQKAYRKLDDQRCELDLSQQTYLVDITIKAYKRYEKECGKNNI